MPDSIIDPRLLMPRGKIYDPRLIPPKRQKKVSGLEKLDELFMGLSYTSPILPRPQQNKKQPDGLKFEQPRLEQLLRANKSRYGGRRPR